MSKLVILLNHNVLFISLLIRILQSLNHIQLPLFMLNKVNDTLLRQFLGFYYLSKLVILWLNHNFFLHNYFYYLGLFLA